MRHSCRGNLKVDSLRLVMMKTWLANPCRRAGMLSRRASQIREHDRLLDFVGPLGGVNNGVSILGGGGGHKGARHT